MIVFANVTAHLKIKFERPDLVESATSCMNF